MRVAGRLRHLNVSEPPISGGAPMRCVGRLGHLDVSEPQFRGRADANSRLLDNKSRGPDFGMPISALKARLLPALFGRLGSAPPVPSSGVWPTWLRDALCAPPSLAKLNGAGIASAVCIAWQYAKHR